MCIVILDDLTCERTPILTPGVIMSIDRSTYQPTKWTVPTGSWVSPWLADITPGGKIRAL